MAEEGFERFHVPQQSRRDKLRVLPQNQSSFLDSSSSSPLPSLYDPYHLFSSDFLPNQQASSLIMGFSTQQGLGSSSSSSSSSVSHHAYIDPQAIHVMNNSNPFLYQPQPLQNLRQFDHSYNDASGRGGNDGIMVFKPVPLSLSLSSSSHNNNAHHLLEVNPQRCGTFNVYGDKVGGGGECVISASNNEVLRCYDTVPFGPFTGYASILKGSRFLKPAQQLLEEICDVGLRGVSNTEKVVADVSLMEPHEDQSFSACGIGMDDSLLGDENESRKNKSRLLTMLDEVYRRYRHYYQQMHAVVTSFECVAGLGNAAPYASLAINAMSKHFRCLKNAITDKLQFINKTHSQANTGKDESLRIPNNDRGGTYSLRPGFFERQQPAWRPQRGLPERAVNVLRAWLFEHFLHPYPTDTDKLMLAKQTGLSRSQVSNWFINARVRLWKPMVEEIHMLESQQAQKKSQRGEHSRNLSDHSSLVTENQCSNKDKCFRNVVPNMGMGSEEQVNVGGVNMGVSNGVSLTLGLHQNHGIGLSETFGMGAAQRVGLALQSEGYVMSGFESQNRHFGRDVVIGGGQLLHDFVG